MENARNVEITRADKTTVLITEIALQPGRSTINLNKDLIMYGYYTMCNDDSRKRKRANDVRVKVRVSLCETSCQHAAALLQSSALSNMRESLLMDMPTFVAMGTIPLGSMLKRGVVNETRLGKTCLLHCVVSTFVKGHAMYDKLSKIKCVADIEELTKCTFALIDIAEDGTCPSAASDWDGKKSVYFNVNIDDGTRPTLATLPTSCPPSEFVVWRILAHLAPFVCTDPGVRKFYHTSMFMRDNDTDEFEPVTDLNALCHHDQSFFTYRLHKTKLQTVHALCDQLKVLEDLNPADDPVEHAHRAFFLHAGHNLIAPLIAATNANKFLWLDASPHNILMQ